jgi:alginate O-acetyltransferase complex protein AlgJ
MQTKSDRGLPEFLPGVALALLLVLGLASSTIAILSPKGLALLQDMRLRDFATGQVTEAQSRLLNDELLGGDLLARTARAIDWRFLGDLGGQVRRGCEGWLFLREELDVHPDREAVMARRAAMVGRVAGILRSRNIALALALVPDKSRVESGRLCDLKRAASLGGRYEQFNAFAVARGAQTIDLLEVLGGLEGERYFRSDTHWNERGAKAAAQAIARHLEGRGIAPPRGPAIETKTGPVRERIGDLIRLAGLADLPGPLRPAGDSVAESTTLLPAPTSDDLLGEMAGPPVVVVGSSYSKNGNFIGFLSAALSSLVGNVAQDGARFAGAATAYFNNAAFKESPPRTLVWEIPERHVDEPFTAEEAAWEARLAAGEL